MGENQTKRTSVQLQMNVCVYWNGSFPGISHSHCIWIEKDFFIVTQSFIICNWFLFLAYDKCKTIFLRFDVSFTQRYSRTLKEHLDNQFVFFVCHFSFLANRYRFRLFKMHPFLECVHARTVSKWLISTALIFENITFF